MVKTVDAYIDGLPAGEAIVVESLRELILLLVPGVQEKLSFKIPFYHYFGMFCYINRTRGGIDLGFCRGKDLVEEFPQLLLKERAIVATVCIKTKKDIVRLQVREIVVAAAIWNETAKKNKIPMVKRSRGRT
jgi:uncharacterized protein